MSEYVPEHPAELEEKSTTCCHSAQAQEAVSLGQGGAEEDAATCCHGGQSEEADSCCAQPARRDYFFMVCVVLVTVTYVMGALQGEHQHDTVLQVFVGGIYELFNLMWWGIALGIVFVGLLARVPRELV
ncbi:MAG: hypothetical protein HOC23_07845, partial [Halieaceae bacterium]|nr:hypothetical protein [Halieaceae bacterium]